MLSAIGMTVCLHTQYHVFDGNNSLFQRLRLQLNIKQPSCDASHPSIQQTHELSCRRTQTQHTYTQFVQWQGWPPAMDVGATGYDVRYVPVYHILTNFDRCIYISCKQLAGAGTDPRYAMSMQTVHTTCRKEIRQPALTHLFYSSDQSLR
jgi:hypothetical protein